MSLLEQQVIDLRRKYELLKLSQVSITDYEPKSPTKQSIWRDGASIKIWDDRNWQTIAGSSIGFSVDIVFTPTDYDTVSWSAGVINVDYPNGVATFSLASGSFNLTTTTYFYWQSDIPNAVQTTTVAEIAIQAGGILLGTGFPNADTTGKVSMSIFGGKGTSPYIVNADIASAAVTGVKIAANTITAANIAAGTITANEIAAGTITASRIVAGTITANEINSALIYAGSITLSSGGVIRSGKVTYADSLTGFWLGSDSGTPKFKIGTSTEYMNWSGSAFDIVGGTITGAWLRTADTGDRIEMVGSSLRAYDSAGNLRTRVTSGGISLYGTTFGEIGVIYENSTGTIFSNDSAVFEFAGEIKITGSSGGFYAESGRPKWKLGADKGSIPYRDTTSILTYGGTANRQIPLMVDGSLYYVQAAI